MFFLIRCVFWLAIVFSTIFATDHARDHMQLGPGHPPDAVARAVRQEDPKDAAAAQAISRTVQAWTTAALMQFWNKAAGSCAGTPADCVALAARLSDFARKHPFEALPEAGPNTGTKIVSDAGAEPQAPVSTAKRMASPPTPTRLADVPLPPLRPQHPQRHEKAVDPKVAKTKAAADGQALEAERLRRAAL